MRRQAQGGDRAAFGCLVGEFQDLISALCLGHLGDPERARDAAQGTFVTALGAIKSLREPWGLRCLVAEAGPDRVPT